MIELTTFRLVEGAAEADLAAADRVVQTRFAHHQPGFARRTTARAEDGSWAVVTLWHSTEAADAAAAAGSADAAVCALLALVDPASVEVRRFFELD